MPAAGVDTVMTTAPTSVDAPVATGSSRIDQMIVRLFVAGVIGGALSAALSMLAAALGHFDWELAYFTARFVELIMAAINFPVAAFFGTVLLIGPVGRGWSSSRRPAILILALGLALMI